MDSNNLDCVKNSIVKINPNIDVKITSHSLYKTLVEELGYLK